MSVMPPDIDMDTEVRLRVLESTLKKADELEEDVRALKLRLDNINRIFWGVVVTSLTGSIIPLTVHILMG
jgi:hypothetical protein